MEPIKVPVAFHLSEDQMDFAIESLDNSNEHLYPFIELEAVYFIVDEMPFFVEVEDDSDIMRDMTLGKNVIDIFIFEQVLFHSNDMRGIDSSRWPCDPKRFIAISRTMKKDTLVHEIGHYFGLKHIKEHSNIMKSGNRSDHASLSARQLTTMRNNAKRMRMPIFCIN
jgi:hypothetical protein